MYLFEFLDQDWLPGSIRTTMLEILETVNSFPFRGYDRWIVDEVLRLANEDGITHIVELGAGAAPLTKALAKRHAADALSLSYCDHFPDTAAFAAIHQSLGDRVTPIYDPVDFSLHHKWPENTLLVLSATFHHISFERRAEVIEALSTSAQRVVVFEPLRKNILSIILVLLSLIPSLLLPLLKPGKGSLRRMLWCWLLPLAPLLFVWDGVISCLRQWSQLEWTSQISRALGEKAFPRVKETFFSQMVLW